ncbi:4711_t:CDS:2 [Funneliformis geosporum]|nr:4711_t:CDS:2 [Funneliformis geosporum]
MKNSWFSPPTDQKLTVNELKRKLEPYIVEGESHLRESLCGTHASSLFDSITSSGACIEEISLPLLSSERAQEVILDLANRNQEKGTRPKDSHFKYHYF